MSTVNLLLSAVEAALRGERVVPPAGGELAWSWFIALCRTRTGHVFGPNPISYAEIEAYARLYRWPIKPQHVDMILAMDRVWMEHARELSGGNRQMPPSSDGHGQEMTPAAFDAVFG